MNQHHYIPSILTHEKNNKLQNPPYQDWLITIKEKQQENKTIKQDPIYEEHGGDGYAASSIEQNNKTRQITNEMPPQKEKLAAEYSFKPNSVKISPTKTCKTSSKISSTGI